MTNREIKFRAWNKEVGMMFPLDESINLEELRKGVISHDGENWIKCIYMEFTGLYDKNGVEIYEGDIIRINVGYFFNNRKVEYKNGAFLLDGYFEFAKRLKNCEVIGNIHQNPDLLIK